VIGNQAIINRQLIDHEDNPIKEPINGISIEDITCMITHEYWKEWKSLMKRSEKPIVWAPGIGQFEVMYPRAKFILRKLLTKIRWNRIKYGDDWKNPEKKAYGINKVYCERFRTIWKQVDLLKKEVNYRYALWEKKKKLKYGDKAI